MIEIDYVIGYNDFLRYLIMALLENNSAPFSITRRELIALSAGLGTTALLFAKIGFILPFLTIPLALGAGGYMRGIILGDKEPLKRAAKWAGIGLIATALLACGELEQALPSPTPPLEIQGPTIVKPSQSELMRTPSPTPPHKESIDLKLKFPVSAFLSSATRLMPDRSVGLENLPVNTKQRDILARVLLENQISVRGGAVATALEAEKNGTLIGFSGCGDSRDIAPFTFPITQAGVQAQEYMASYGVTMQTRMIGTQPAVFKKGVNLSVFNAHVTCADANDGCGALGAIKAIMNGGKQNLLDHGVSPATISQLEQMIKAGATPNPYIWSKEGAKIQAALNYKAHGGVNHFTAWGVSGHADGSFSVFGVVDSFGNEYKIEEFPLLDQFSKYFNEPHPVLAEVAAGQKPWANFFNASKTKSSDQLLGRLAQERGGIFKITANLDNTPLTVAEIRKMIGGMEYSLSHLPQDGKVLIFAADNVKDMRLAVTTFLAEAPNVEKFIQEGGVIVELITDTTGEFNGLMTVRSNATLAYEFSVMKGLAVNKLKINDGLLKEAEDIILKRVKMGTISESTASKIMAMLKFLRPVGTVAKYGLKIAGDAMLISDFVDWFKKTITGFEVEYEIPPQNWAIVPNGKDNRLIITNIQAKNFYNPTSPQERNFGDPYLENGKIIGFKIGYDEMREAYAKAFQAWLKHGPGANQADIPWNQIKSLEELGRMVTFIVPGINLDNFPTKDFSEFSTVPRKHITELLIQPQIGPDGKIVFNQNDTKQVMMMIDMQTGLPISGLIKESRVITSYCTDDPNLVYYWLLESDPIKREYFIQPIRAVQIKK